MKSRRTFAVMAVALCLVISVNLAAQQFPRLQEENLDGHQVMLPDTASGKVAVLVMGFTRASKTPTEAWAKRILSDFGETTGFELYQLPVLEEVPRMIRGMVISGIRTGVPENMRANFIPVLHNEADLKKLVAYKEPDDAYIVVLDHSGRIAYQAHSATPGQGYAKVRGQVENLLK